MTLKELEAVLSEGKFSYSVKKSSMIIFEMKEKSEYRIQINPLPYIGKLYIDVYKNDEKVLEESSMKIEESVVLPMLKKVGLPTFTEVK